MIEKGTATDTRKTILKSFGIRSISPFVDGRSIDSCSSSQIATYDPYSGVASGEIPAGSDDDVNLAVRAARHSFELGSWRKMPPSQRRHLLHRWADLIEANASRLDLLDAFEMGKPISVKLFGASAAANFTRFNADAMDKWTGDVWPSDSTTTVYQTKVPRGVVAAIVPWNFPTYNALLKIAPALAAGNSVVLKPSELSSGSALVLAGLALEAGLPLGVLNVVPGRGEIVGRALGEHLDVNMVAFTGSSSVGRLMMQYSGRSNMKVVSAECGGKSPQIVFDDGVDVDLAAKSVAQLLVINQGQICSVGSRLLVQDRVADRVVEQIIKALADIVPGDPSEPSTTYGPLVSEPQLKRVCSYISSGKVEGAKIVAGGSRLFEGRGGYFVEPTVFTEVAEQNTIAREEIFGPVLSVLRFRDADEAARLANATSYGLAAYVWTGSLANGMRMASTVNSGATVINAILPTGEGPGSAFSLEPFGQSGIGVEGGMAGLESYLRRQTILINHG